MSKERRKLEAVSKGAVNLLDPTAAVGGESETAQEPCCSDGTAVGGESETAQVRCCSDETAVGGGHDNHLHSGTEAHDKTAQEPCCSDGTAVGGESETAVGDESVTKEAEGVVSGFVPNPTVMLVRLATSGVVVPVIQVRAYLFRRGMAVRVYRAFDGWRLK